LLTCPFDLIDADHALAAKGHRDFCHDILCIAASTIPNLLDPAVASKLHDWAPRVVQHLRKLGQGHALDHRQLAVAHRLVGLLVGSLLLERLHEGGGATP
jgi:hypothetical protein